MGPRYPYFCKMVRFTGQMTKETRLTFRVRAELKKNLESIAAKEARSVAQVCDVMLQSGVAAYQKQGTKYLHRLISSQKTKGDGV